MHEQLGDEMIPKTFEGHDVEEVAQALHHYHQRHIEAGDLALTTDVGRSYFWAVETLIRAARSQPEFCWDVVLASLDGKVSEMELAYIAAGPLEDLVSAHPSPFVDRLRDLARKEPRVAELIQYMVPPLE